MVFEGFYTKRKKLRNWRSTGRNLMENSLDDLPGPLGIHQTQKYDDEWSTRGSLYSPLWIFISWSQLLTKSNIFLISSACKNFFRFTLKLVNPKNHNEFIIKRIQKTLVEMVPALTNSSNCSTGRTFFRTLI